MKPRLFSTGALLLAQATIASAVLAATGGPRLALIATLAAASVLLTRQRSAQALACGLLTAAAIAVIATGQANGRQLPPGTALNERRCEDPTLVTLRRSRHGLSSTHRYVLVPGPAPSSLISGRTRRTALTCATEAPSRARGASKATDRVSGPRLPSSTHHDRERRFT